MKRIFKRNSLVIKFELLTFMKVYLVFYATFVSYIAIDFLSKQRQESRKSIVAKNNEKS